MVLKYLRPYLVISDDISCIKDKDGENIFLIKILNKSFFDVFDVRVDFFKVRIIPMPNNKTNKKIKELPLIDPFIPHIKKWDKKDFNAEYAYRVICKENLIEILNGNEDVILEIKIIARHGLSGLSNVFYKRYKSYNIKEGEFLWGKDLTIR